MNTTPKKLAVFCNCGVPHDGQGANYADESLALLEHDDLLDFAIHDGGLTEDEAERALEDLD